jgi:ABC-type sugar transport system permease subunit
MRPLPLLRWWRGLDRLGHRIVLTGAAAAVLGIVALVHWWDTYWGQWVAGNVLPPSLWTLAGIAIWDIAGFNMVLFLAGLAAIPREVYDAAAIDGAGSAWSRLRYITWPLLGPTTLFVVIVTAIRALRAFDTVALLTQGGPAKSTDVILYRITTTAFQYLRIGYASALTVAFLIAVVALALLQSRWGRRPHDT